MSKNNRYIRSANRERELVNAFRKRGFISARSAGSHSPTDVWAFHPAKRVLYMVQVKVKKRATSVKMLHLKTTTNVSAYSWTEQAY